MKMESIQLAFVRTTDDQRIRLWHIDAYRPDPTIDNATQVSVGGTKLTVQMLVDEFEELLQMVTR